MDHNIHWTNHQHPNMDPTYPQGQTYLFQMSNVSFLWIYLTYGSTCQHQHQNFGRQVYWGQSSLLNPVKSTVWLRTHNFFLPELWYIRERCLPISVLVNTSPRYRVWSNQSILGQRSTTSTLMGWTVHPAQDTSSTTITNTAQRSLMTAWNG